jgi:heme A synthase
MENIGGVFGLIGLFSIIFLVSRPLLQAVGDQLRKQGKKLPDPVKKVSQFVTKYHRYAGFVAIGAIVMHFILQYTRYGEVPLSGLIAGLALAVQATLGFGLTRLKDKAKRKKLALVHRIWGMMLVVAVLVHRLS